MGRLHEACGQPLEEICIEEATLLACFPKFCALRGILKERCEEQSEFHGMVFVRTRLVSKPHWRPSHMVPFAAM